MTIYSHSRLSTYETCPLQYKFRYLEKPDVKKKQGIEAFLGTCFHETMEKLYGDLPFDKINTEEELIDYYLSQWEKNYTEDIVVVKKERTVQDYQNLGRKCISAYYKKHYPFNQSQTLGIEEKIEIDLDGSGKYRVQGYIDRLTQDEDGSYQIHDYKTSSSLPNQQKLDKDRQLALYHEGLRQNFADVSEVKLVWHYVVFDKTMTSVRNVGELDILKKQTIELIDKIESAEEFLPKESALCNWCDYRCVCPLKKHECVTAKLPENKFLKEEGVSLVNMLADIEEEKKDLKQQIVQKEKLITEIKEALLLYAEKENLQIVVGKDKMAKLSTQTKVDIPKKNTDQWNQLKDVLVDLKKEGDFLSIDTALLKKAFKGNVFSEDEVKQLQEFYDISEVRQVRLSKIKDT